MYINIKWAHAANQDICITDPAELVYHFIVSHKLFLKQNNAQSHQRFICMTFVSSRSCGNEQ